MKRVTKDNYLPLSISIVACLSSSAAATFTFDECKEAKKLGILLGKFCNEKRNYNQSALNMSLLLFHRMS